MASIPLAALHVNPPTPPENPLEQYARIAQLQGLANQRQLQQQEIQGAQLENQQRQIQLDQSRALMDTAKDVDWTKDDAFDKFLSSAQSSGKVNPQTLSAMSLQRAQYKEQLAKTDTATLAAERDRNNQLLGHLDAIKSETDPTKRAAAAQAQAQQILSGGLIKDPNTTQKVQAMASGQYVPTDDDLKIFEGGLLDHKTQIDLAIKDADLASKKAQLPGQQAEADQKVRANAATQLAGATSQQQYAQLLGELPFKVASAFPTPDKWTPEAKDQILQAGMTPHEQAQVPMEKLEYKDWAQQQQAAGKPSDRASFMKYQKTLVPQFNFNLAANGGPAPGTPVADVAKRFNLTPEAFDQQAEKYFQTGNLPPFGRGNPASLALNKALMNRANELHPGASLAGNEAAFKANQESLKKLQSNFDQVTAFENTAGKNLDTFLDQAKKVVDYGSPLVNMPLRKAALLAGSKDQAAFNAARATALTEISKVLNSSNASGVLSDSARHEVEELIGPDASLKQIYSAAQILKTDMANRHQAYQDQISDIQKRTAGTGGGSGLSGSAASQGGGTVNMKAPNGMVKPVPADQVEHYKSLGATVVQ